MFVFSPRNKRVICAASAVRRNFTVQLISYTAYKYKMPAQPRRVSSLLYDTCLLPPHQSSVFSPSCLSRPASQSLPVQCQSTSRGVASLCTSFAQPPSAAEVLGAGHTTQHVLLEAGMGSTSTQSTRQAALLLLGRKRHVRLPVT